MTLVTLRPPFASQEAPTPLVGASTLQDICAPARQGITEESHHWPHGRDPTAGVKPWAAAWLRQIAAEFHIVIVFGTMPIHTQRGGALGFFDKLFGIGRDNPAKRTVEDGEICAKCGQPVPRDNMAFDSGGGRPIHRVCPARTTE